MSNYVIVQTGDSVEPGVPNPGTEIAANLAAIGHDVTVFFVQNGVFLARRGTQREEQTGAHKAGMTLLADDFSLRERGIGTDQLSPGVSPSPLESLVDLLAAGSKVLWH